MCSKKMKKSQIQLQLYGLNLFFQVVYGVD